SNKLKGKDLITIGIYTAIYFVINFAFMLAGMIPVMWIMMPSLIALFTGVPYMMICNKVQKAGAILIMGTVTVLIYYATGQFTTVILATFAVGCILAEIIRAITRYTSFIGNTLSFALFSIGMIGSPLPIWLFKESFFAHISEVGMSQDYINALEKFTSPAILIGVIILTFICSLVGALIAKRMMNKHFKKAGII
ncbi:TPA: MptD family putative ECF transporter S component, partial [Streptococcus equi subsp. equi]|nr:MptD family putative ECF transporter S component [Streptococcus equi subsp. equi]HEL0924697.1 MptD family putative ECF transporter S component [Streptococcus equi subsp. equi]